MNTLKKTLLVVFSALFLVCAAMFAVACGEKDPTLYTVTVTYDDAKGSVTLDPAAEDNKYEEGATVTVTVSANEGYEVDEVKVNGSAVALTNGKYTLTVEKDTTVAATFKAEDESNVTYYTVTADYDETKGNVTLSPAAEDNKYEEGATVTVIVAVNPGGEYEVDTFTVNGEAVTLTNGSYTFTVEGDTVVAVTFKKVVAEITYYTVTVASYDETMGTVTVDPMPADGKYAEGTSVTLTVTANAGYVIKSVSVGVDGRLRPVTLTNGSYTFTVEGNTAIEVYLGVDDGDLPTLNLELGMEWRGTWKTANETHVVYISADGYKLSLDGVGAGLIMPATNTVATGYDFEIDGKEYTLSWADSLYAIGIMFQLHSYNDGEVWYLAKNPVSEIEDKYNGTWYAENGSIVLEITKDSITYNGVKAELVADAGYVESTGGEFGAPVQAHVYPFVVGGVYYALSWYPTGNVPTINDDYFTRTPHDNSVTIPSDYHGTWVGRGVNARTLVISANSITIDGRAAEITNGEMVSFAVVENGKVYELYIFDDYVLFFRQYTYNNQGLIIGWEDTEYFVTENYQKNITLPDYMHGTWTASGTSAIVIDGDGIRWGNVIGEIVGQEQRGGDSGDVPAPASYALAAANETYYNYTVIFNGVAYHLFYNDAGEQIVIDGNEGSFTFMGDSIPAAYRGTWNGGDLGTIIITASGFNYHGTSYELQGATDGFSFTIGTTVYTVSLMEGLGGPVLTVTYLYTDSTWVTDYVTDYYLQEGATYSEVTVDSNLYGNWTANGQAALGINAGGITYGGEEVKLLAYDAESEYYTFYANGKLYILTYVEATQTTPEHLTLHLYYDYANIITYNK